MIDMRRENDRGPLVLWLAGVLWLGAILIFSPLLRASDAATITYRRVFKGSNPEFIEIKIGEDGTATYDIRQLSDDPDPEPFHVGDAVRMKVFELAGELHNFEGLDLDVHRRIADLGQKTFRYEKSAEAHETHYNYTLNRPATQLALVFEGLFLQQRDLMDLERKLKYDRLGVNDSLRQFEMDLAQQALPEPDQLLGVLDRIGTDTRVIDVARQRARALAERIRIATPDSASPAPAKARP
jgi:hypothetical protein